MDSNGIQERLRILQESEQVVLLCVGEEEGSKTGYKHYQGFVQFTSKKSPLQVKQKLTEQTHVESAKSTAKQCIEYCRKEHKVRYEKNLQNYKPIEEKRQVKGDEYWKQLIKDCEEMEADEIREKYPKDWVLRRSALERMIVEASSKRARTWNGILQRKNYWIWGKPGVGKSRWATNQKPAFNTLRKNNNKWWCNYDCSQTRLVIIEDYPALPQGDALQHHMKVWADRYPFLGEIKGGGVTIEPGRWAFVVTSNYSIDECFSHEQDRQALHRRFQEIEMTKANEKLINATRIDFGILTVRKKMKMAESGEENEEDEEEMFDAVQDLLNHEEEVALMQEESRQRAEQGLDQEEEW
jgi:hypothetical protein